jgi:predicted nucleic acid-binding Zn ribbon protein
MEDPRNSKTDWGRWNVDRIRFHLDKPPAPRRDIRPIGDVLQDVVAGLEQPQDENILILREAWPEIAGAQIAKHSLPVNLQNFVLHVEVDHPGWLPELERLKRVLLQKLQSSYRELRIRQLHFSLRSR